MRIEPGTKVVLFAEKLPPLYLRLPVGTDVTMICKILRMLWKTYAPGLGLIASTLAAQRIGPRHLMVEGIHLYIPIVAPESGDSSIYER